MEVGAVLVYPLIFDRDDSRDELLRELRATPASDLLADEPGIDADSSHPPIGRIPHPYTGFVRGSVEGEPTNEYGFYGPQPVVKRAPGRTNVALVGGSLALHMYRHARDVLESELRRVPRFSGQEIEMISLALPGYKQPQQLLALTYMTYLGAQYDIVINLDGFNEVVLPFSENLPSGTFLHHPRMWNVLVRTGLNEADTLDAAEMIRLRRWQLRLRRFFASAAVNWSNLALLVWRGLDRDAETRILRLDESYRTRMDAADGPPRLGPEVDYEEDWTRYFLDAVNGWARASMHIHGLARTRGFRYFHFLQPNQYVEGSKPLSPKERRIAHIDGLQGEASAPQRAYKWAAEFGYPVLSSAGRTLTRRGVEFVDLTMMFEGVQRTLYDDMCCHLNHEGYRRLARRVGREVGARLTSAPRNRGEVPVPRGRRRVGRVLPPLDPG